MILWLWTFFRGYVEIEVTGFSLERFLNMAAHKNIYLWNVRREENRVRLCVSIRGFKMLRHCARKTKSRMRIAEKKGAPFYMHRYRKRKLLIGGVLFFILSLYFLSMFVWRIDVIGNERISQQEILAFCRDNGGLTIGALKYRVDQNKIRQDLLEHFDDIGWADIYTKGTRTTITLTEIIPAQPIVPKDEPCDIIAAKDGLIIGIVTGAGIPQVKQNDVVRQGQVLVSGTIPLNMEHTGQQSVEYVHSYAEVWARMYTRVEFTVPLTYTEKIYTGKSVSHFSVQWLFAGTGRLNLYSGRISYENYDRIVSHTQWGSSGDYPLPFIWTKEEYREFTPVTRERTLDEAKALAERMLNGRVMREFDFHADIVDKKIEFTEQPGSLSVRALIVTHERIDSAVPLKLPNIEQNAESTENK